MVGVSKNDGVFTNPMQTYPHLEQSWHIAKQQYDKLHRLSCKGIKYLEHIFEGTDFIPFDKLIKQYGINKNRFLEYQQIKSIVKRKFKSNHINLQIPPSVSDFLNLKTPKLMSKIYRALSKIDESVSLPIANGKQIYQ